VAKVSDAPGKVVSKDAGYLAYLRQVFGLEKGSEQFSKSTVNDDS
jgi:hypothetical protein